MYCIINFILLSNERMIGKCEWEGCQNVLRGNLNPLNTLKKLFHPAGDVLWVFVEPGNVVP